MLTGTLVTVAGFVLIGFARSSAGEYTFSIFAVVAIALLASWVVAVVFSPLLGVWILNKPKVAHSEEPGRILRTFRRFLELASEPDPYDNPRGAARVMEFARGTFIEYLHSQAERGAHVAEIRARGRRMTAEWPNWPNVIHGEYMLEVFEGYSNHNYRGKPDPACEHSVKAKAGD